MAWLTTDQYLALEFNLKTFKLEPVALLLQFKLETQKEQDQSIIVFEAHVLKHCQGGLIHLFLLFWVLWLVHAA